MGKTKTKDNFLKSNFIFWTKSFHLRSVKPPQSAKMRDVSGYLTKQIDASSEGSEVIEMWRQIEDFHTRRLWHQLTQVLLKLVQKPEVSGQLKEIYENVICEFETKLNPLSLVQILIPVVGAMEDKDEALAFVEKVANKVKGAKDKEAYILTKVITADIQLNHYKNKDKVKELVEEIETLLDEVEGVDYVHSKFYLMASDLHKQDANYAEYYRSSLRFLGCTDLATLSQQEQASQAYHLCLAALLGKDIFNFGELLAHAILLSLKDTPQQWVVELLTAFNSGDVGRYEAMQPAWSAVPDLVANKAVLGNKICLLALMEMTFRRPSTDRLLSFDAIAAQTKIPVDQVEFLVMRALAKGLVKGSIDQVDRTVNLTWVQPRVLDKDQLKTLMGKISNLTGSIRTMENMIENNASEILNEV